MTLPSFATSVTDARVRGCHFCMIFEDDDQRRRVVSEYMAAGLRSGERVRFVADGTSRETVRRWLGERGIDPLAEEARGAFGILPADDAYCAGGRHDPEATIARIKQGYDAAQAGGFTGSRTCGEMSWVLKGLPGSERFLEYEMAINRIDVPFPHSGMCQYDARLFDGGTLFKVLRIHPFMVAEGQIVQNPYFVGGS
jgi:hypothetical protein